MTIISDAIRSFGARWSAYDRDGKPAVMANLPAITFLPAGYPYEGLVFTDGKRIFFLLTTVLAVDVSYLLNTFYSRESRFLVKVSSEML
jgi:hypothetical protein